MKVVEKFETDYISNGTSLVDEKMLNFLPMVLEQNYLEISSGHTILMVLVFLLFSYTLLLY